METKKHLFVVEDDEYIRSDLAQLLEMEGYTVEAFPNGLVALTALSEAQAEAPRPDLIILDLMMPVLDGYGFIDRLHSEPGYRRAPILVMSADGQAAARLRGRNVEGFLKKPIDLDGFLERVEALSGKTRVA